MSNTFDAHTVPLPKRVFTKTLKDIEPKAKRLAGGYDAVLRNAFGMSAAEWTFDIDWVFDQQERHSLSQEQCEILKNRLRQRHRECWGEHNTHTPD